MDIRNFFGKPREPKPAAKVSTTSTPPTVSDSEVTLTPPTHDVNHLKNSATTDGTNEMNILEENNSSEMTISLSPQKIPSDLLSIITWKPHEPVPYAAVAAAFDKIAATSSRLEKESTLCRLYRAVVVTTPEDLECVIYLTSNAVSPAYEGLELGIGDALLIKAVVDATGRNRAAVQAAYKADGDLGIVACQSRSSQSTLAFGAKPKPLTARFVLEQLRVITKISGTKSMDRKVGIIKKMMVSCQGDEAKYIVRALQGKLRIGTAAQTVLVGLAHAFANPPALVPVSSDEVSDSATGAVCVGEVEEDGLEDSEEEENNHSKKKQGRKPSKRVVDDDDYDDKEEAEDEAEVGNAEEKKEEVEIEEVELTDGSPSVDKEEGNGMEMEIVSPSTEPGKKLPTSVPGLEFDDITDDNFLEIMGLIPTNPPPEAVKLNTSKKLSKEVRNELAVIAVKRAFSECPSLTVLSNSLLQNQYSLHELHRFCRLTPGT
jgi:hypothetical protein